MISARPKPRYQLIAEDIRSRIQSGALRPGQAMPSYRTLMKQHGVTIGTVRQAIQSLQSENLVETQPRIGCVVAEKKVIWRKVGVAILGACNPTYASVLEALQGEFARMACDVTVNFVATVNDRSLQALVDWGRRQDGVLLLGWVPVGVIEALIQAGVRVVQCGEPIDGPCPARASGVAISVEGVVGMAVGHLVGLGHRSIALCTPSGSRYFEMLASCFRSSCAEYGVEGRLHILKITEDDFVRPLKEWLDGLATPPSALLVENARTASTTVAYLEANGWPIPRRISVLGTAIGTHEPGIMEGLSCVLTATREMFLRAVGILLTTMQDRNAFPQHEIIVSKLLPGQTCRPLL